jgi:hypothetical protein
VKKGGVVLITFDHPISPAGVTDELRSRYELAQELGNVKASNIGRWRL